VVDDDDRVLGEALPVDQPLVRLGPAQIVERGQAQTDEELFLIPGAKTEQGAVETGESKIPEPKQAEQPFHLFTFNQQMQNKKFVQIVIWVVVISMVLGLGITVFVLLS